MNPSDTDFLWVIFQKKRKQYVQIFKRKLKVELNGAQFFVQNFSVILWLFKFGSVLNERHFQHPLRPNIQFFSLSLFRNKLLQTTFLGVKKNGLKIFWIGIWCKKIGIKFIRDIYLFVCLFVEISWWQQHKQFVRGLKNFVHWFLPLFF